MQRRGGSGLAFGLWVMVLLEFVTAAVMSAEVARHLDLHWLPATATWYGSPEGDGSDGKLINSRSSFHVYGA